MNLPNFNFQRMNPFAPNPSQPSTPAQSNQNSNQPQNPQQPQNPNQPAQGANPNGNNPENMPDPTAAYANLFNPMPADPNKPVDKAPEFTLNPDNLKKVQESLDFSQGLPPEMLEKLQSGEQFNNQEILQMMQHVGRTAYAHSMNHQSKVTEKYVGAHSEYSQKSLPKLLRQLNTSQRVRGLPAAQDNPVVQEHMETIAGKLAERYPDASDEWVTEQTKNYFINMAKAVSPDAFPEQGGNGQRPGKKDNFDWDAFMKTENQDQ